MIRSRIRHKNGRDRRCRLRGLMEGDEFNMFPEILE